MWIQGNMMLSTLACLSCIVCALGSVLVPTYVLPPSSFWPPRGQRSPQPASRTLERLAGGHLRLPPLSPSPDPNKITIDYARNSFIDKDTKNHDGKNSFEDSKLDKEEWNEVNSYEKEKQKDSSWSVSHKDVKGYDDKFAGVVVKVEGQNVGWNQGQWDDGMLMSSAGNGKEKGKKGGEDDEEKKTLADQVAEGKYGLIQKELFIKPPVRPGVISYGENPETVQKDNKNNLGGLKDEEVWLADDHLLVLKGGSFPDHGASSNGAPAWPAIDSYQAPPRQVKIPHNPKVPPPFPVRLSEGGPLVFLTPNGSIPASLFPAFPPQPPFGFDGPPGSAAAPPPGGPYKGDAPAGGAPFPLPPFAFTQRNESEGFPPPPPGYPLNFPPGFNPGFGPPINGSFLNGPPANLSDLYDEDDPSIYYPPPYSFTYKVDNASRATAGPLVPGIVLPPPPDFFAPLEESSPKPNKTSPTRKPQTYIPAALPDGPDNSITDNSISTVAPKTVTITSRPVQRIPDRVVVIAKPSPPRKHHVYTPPPPVSIVTPTQAKLVEKKPTIVTVLHKQPVKTTLKPVIGLYDYPDKNYYEGNSVSPSPQPFLVYGPPEGKRVNQQDDKAFVTSTPVPLRAYYSNPTYDNVISQVQYTRQNPVAQVAPANTRLRPEFFNSRQNGKSVASFYFYEEPVGKSVASTPAPATYFDGRNYYQAVNGNAAQNAQDNYYYNPQVQNGFTPSADLDYRAVPSRDPSPFFFVPQRQGSRTLTQEYFSIQKPKQQQTNNYIQQQVIQHQQVRPNSFYDQIANIQQTIDYFTTNRPKLNIYQQNGYREIRQKPKPSPRPIYQFSFQKNNLRQEQNTFRAPKMDEEPFRPMVSYSKPYNQDEDYISTPKINYISEQKVTTETPQKLFTTIKPAQFDYDDVLQENKNNAERALPKPTPRPHAVTPASALKQNKYRVQSTKAPVNHAYYTKQEEGLFDDITKNYFTIFGQKIEDSNRDGSGIAVTSPIRPNIEVSTIKTPLNNAINIQYDNEESHQQSYHVEPERQQIISLASDTDVNYRNPRPLINPESEFIPIVNPEVQAKYEAEQNLRNGRIQIQRYPNVEIIKSEGIQQEEVKEVQQLQYVRPQQSQNLQGLYHSNGGRAQVAEGRPGSLIAYRLPGEGAHVYFLTPQPARNGDGLKFKTAEQIAELS